MSKTEGKQRSAMSAVRDQVMPQYRYPAAAAESSSLIVRQCGNGVAARPSVLVNGAIAY